MNSKKQFANIVIIFLVAALKMQAQNINRPNFACPMGINVNSYSGNMYLERKDLYIKGRKLPLNFTFFYNSNMDSLDLGYGNGWSMEYLMRYEATVNGLRVCKGDGYEMEFEQISTTNFKPPKGVFDSLVQYQTKKFVLISKHRMKYFFDDSTHRKLTRIEEPNGNFLNFTYSNGLLTQVNDAASRSIQLTYVNNRLSEITDALDTPVRKYKYKYDAYGNLIEAEDPLGNKFKYEYIINGPLKRLTDKNGNVADIIYSSGHNVKEVITCITNQRFSYDKTKGVTLMVELVSGQNQTTTYRYNAKGYLAHKEGNCCGYNVKYEYDNDGNVTKFTDANGHVYISTYDNRGNMLSLKDPLGNSELYVYESVFDRIISYTDKNGNTTTYTHDAKGNQTSISLPLSIINSFTYAGNGDKISFTNGRGFTTTYIYDFYGNMISEIKPLNSTTTFTYDNRSRLLTKSNPLNHSTSYRYDLLNRMLSVKNALNDSVGYTYDATGNIISFLDANSNHTLYAYDALDRIVTNTNALGKSKMIIYDARNNITSLTDENYNTIKYRYDNLNRIIERSNELNEIFLLSYDGNGNVISAIQPNGNIVTATYDKLNRLIDLNDAIGASMNYNYDNKNSRLSRTDANGNTTTYLYDELNRLINITDALGHSYLFSYDANSNRTSVTNRNGHTSVYLYDELDRQTSITDALNYTTTFGYDLVNNLTSLTDPNNHSTIYTYDALNRNISETFANGSARTYTYFANGNIKSRVDGNNVITNYFYDAKNRLLKRDYPGSNDDIYTYDDGGRMLSASNADAGISFAYDAANRFISETLNGKTTSYQYNIFNRKIKIQYPSGRIIDQIYDQRKRLTAIEEGGVQIATFAYDLGNRNTEISYKNGIVTSFSFDVLNQITSILSNPGGFHQMNYNYDNEGNKLIEEKVHNPGHSESYVYDNTNQIIEYKKGTISASTIPLPVLHISYNYDGVGNRTNMIKNNVVNSYSINSINGYANITSSNIIPIYDNNGNLTSDGINNYSYDIENRMLSSNNASLSFKYDALGRRIKKISNSDTLAFYFDGQRIIEFRNESDILKNTFVYGRYLDDIISSDTLFYLKNQLGNVYSIVGLDGGRLEFYEYEPFGTVIFYDSISNVIDSSITNNSFLYNGIFFDREINHYYYRKRNLNPVIGRFNQLDPIGIYSGTSNLYKYTSNNPLNFTDPFGLFECKSPGTIMDESTKEAEDRFPDLIDKTTKRDAYRHCLTSCRLSQTYTPITPIIAGVLWEGAGMKDGQPLSEAIMDQWNNILGAGVYNWSGNCSNSCYDGVNNPISPVITSPQQVDPFMNNIKNEIDKVNSEVKEIIRNNVF